MTSQNSPSLQPDSPNLSNLQNFHQHEMQFDSPIKFNDSYHHSQPSEQQQLQFSPTQLQPLTDAFLPIADEEELSQDAFLTHNPHPLDQAQSPKHDSSYADSSPLLELDEEEEEHKLIPSEQAVKPNTSLSKKSKNISKKPLPAPSSSSSTSRGPRPKQQDGDKTNPQKNIWGQIRDYLLNSLRVIYYDASCGPAEESLVAFVRTKMGEASELFATDLKSLLKEFQAKQVKDYWRNKKHRKTIFDLVQSYPGRQGGPAFLELFELVISDPDGKNAILRIYDSSKHQGCEKKKYDFTKETIKAYFDRGSKSIEHSFQAGKRKFEREQQTQLQSPTNQSS